MQTLFLPSPTATLTGQKMACHHLPSHCSSSSSSSSVSILRPHSSPRLSFRIFSIHHSHKPRRQQVPLPPPHPILRISLPFLALTSSALPSMAAETGGKIDAEAIAEAIDDFFNRNPFFVAGVTFVWLVVIPVTQHFLSKCKPISALDAYTKLRDMPSSQLLDIRGKRSLRYLRSPNLKLLNKNVVQVEFVEGGEEAFLRDVLGRFADPADTVVCVLDSFDGESLKVAEILYKNGFKEAYAIKGGLRGKDGWQEIQKDFLPPSMHVYPRKKKNKPTSSSDIYTESSTTEGMDGQSLASSGDGSGINQRSGEPYGEPS